MMDMSNLAFRGLTSTQTGLDTECGGWSVQVVVACWAVFYVSSWLYRRRDTTGNSPYDNVRHASIYWYSAVSTKPIPTAHDRRTARRLAKHASM